MPVTSRDMSNGANPAASLGVTAAVAPSLCPPRPKKYTRHTNKGRRRENRSNMEMKAKEGFRKGKRSRQQGHEISGTASTSPPHTHTHSGSTNAHLPAPTRLYQAPRPTPNSKRSGRISPIPKDTCTTSHISGRRHAITPKLHTRYGHCNCTDIRGDAPAVRPVTRKKLFAHAVTAQRHALTCHLTPRHDTSLHVILRQIA